MVPKIRQKKGLPALCEGDCLNCEGPWPDTAERPWYQHRFDGALENIFDLQDKVTQQVVGAIAPEIDRAEIGTGNGGEDRGRSTSNGKLSPHDAQLASFCCTRMEWYTFS